MSNNLFMQHSATNPFEVMRGIAALIGGGVMDIFPKLRVAFLEAGVGWLPFWMERLDEHYELMPEYVPFLRRKPSEVIRRRISSSRATPTRRRCRSSRISSAPSTSSMRPTTRTSTAASPIR